MNHYYIGLPEWRHPDWYAEGKNPKGALQIYARHLTSVEGNSSFYALPSSASIKEWEIASPDSFRFCFKFPKTISHDAQLRHSSQEVSEFLNRVAPLGEKLGIIWLQMSSRFGPEYLDVLKVFLENLPADFHYGIEVRNERFFQKDENETAFNRLLQQHAVNRTMFDTRILFSNPADDPASKEALKKKPRLPLHVLATSDRPMLRFIAPMEIQLADQALTQWAGKVSEWIDEGKTPYLFFHTPDKQKAPELAQQFSQKLATLRPELKPISLWGKPPQQADLEL